MKLIVSARSSTPFRRAGLLLAPTPTEIEVDDKTAAILKAEPMLVVLEVPAGFRAPTTEDHSKRK
jgi:hypothetical protein